MTAGEEFVTERGVIEVGPAGIAGIVDVELAQGTSLVSRSAPGRSRTDTGRVLNPLQCRQAVASRACRNTSGR